MEGACGEVWGEGDEGEGLPSGRVGEREREGQGGREGDGKRERDRVSE